MRDFDAVLLAVGAEQPRDVAIPGRELKGIHFAMDYLTQQNKRVAGDRFAPAEEIVATGKRVIIIGGGDTGADCLGTAHRQKAASVHQLQINPDAAQRTPSELRRGRCGLCSCGWKPRMKKAACANGAS